MMVAVLLRLRASGLLDELLRLAAYVARGEERGRIRGRLRRSWRFAVAGWRLGEGGLRSSDSLGGC